ncbi:DUF1566 domain-containing protein [Methylomonas koyamae]|uniref:DUF1566 domain-containing protein n=1 Tax=Methylomonas koyamae TaxID=702114 RepID=UPI0009EC32C8|nr:DUF1566 domain-containing protein [Methylomonas koyamae]BBL58336.1 hypothetical protein MKFW12EY_19490 [Methylomonas koyamae]
MNLNSKSKKLKPLILFFAMSLVSFTVQARDSLEALRNDLNVAVTGLQNQIMSLQAKVDALTPVVYEIGDTGPSGGIVFHLTYGGTHGLEAAPIIQIYPWGCNGVEIQGAYDRGVGSGAQNTSDILAGCQNTYSAAGFVHSYSLNGYSDWFLPSRDELNLLYLQRSVIGVTGGEFWSSTEISASSAWRQSFLNGFQYYSGDKNSALQVIPIRAF